MAKATFSWLLLGAAACNPHAVDAVQDPLAEPPPVVVSPLVSSLLHRYSFDGDAAVVLDSKGAAHGQLLGGAKLASDGTLPLAGEHTGQYVNLPNGIVSGLTDATFEAWLTWNGGALWQRIFDFGNSSGGEDMPADGTSYLFLTTKAAQETMQAPTTMRVTYSQNGVADEDYCNASMPFPSAVETHVAVVIDHAAKSMALYQDGVLLRECPLGRPLRGIDDVNNWLGHSNYKADVDLSGIYDEFRIYGAALSAAQLEDSFVAGPDAH